MSTNQKIDQSNDAEDNSDIVEKLKTACKCLDNFHDLLSKWKADNDVHRVNMDLMGEGLKVTMSNIKHIMEEFVKYDSLLAENEPFDRLQYYVMPIAEVKPQNIVAESAIESSSSVITTTTPTTSTTPDMENAKLQLMRDANEMDKDVTIASEIETNKDIASKLPMIKVTPESQAETTSIEDAPKIRRPSKRISEVDSLLNSLPVQSGKENRNTKSISFEGGRYPRKIVTRRRSIARECKTPYKLRESL